MYEIRDYTLTEVVAKSASHYADRPFLGMVGERAITFAEMDKATRKVAASLTAWGLAKGDRVAIVAENSPAWGIAYLAIARAGGVVVPILTDFTAEQMENIVRHAEAVLILCTAKTLPKVKGAEGPRALLDIPTLEPMDAGRGAARPPEAAAMAAALSSYTDAELRKSDLAMIVYTSGTTGLSKGVMLTHENIIFDADACKSIIVLNRRDRLLSILPLAHTYEFTIGFLIPLLMGSHINYLDRPPSASALLPALKVVRPTIMLSVPLVIEKIYHASVRPQLESMKAYSSPVLRPILERFAGIKLMHTFGGKLRFFGIGGAAVAADVEGFLKRARFPYAIGYGLTETAPLLAGCNPSRTFLRSTGPALKGVTLRIADPKPETGEGEIQAKGPNVFGGYYRDPVRTAEAFTPDGWFRTGDLGYVDGKGRVFVRGRIKTMILGASGENIYPEEIEAVLNGSPFVAESLVYGDENGLTALVYLKSEVLENLEARVRDGLEEAGEAASKLGHAVAGAEKAAEKAAAALLEKIRKEANDRLAGFSRLRSVQMHDEPFEKTPTQKIKRFMYPRKADHKAEDTRKS